MEKYLIKRKPIEEESSKINNSCPKQVRVELNLDDLPSDPGLRKQILEYNLNDRDKVQRTYLQKGPCQPHEYNFPQRKIGAALRRFIPKWFKD